MTTSSRRSRTLIGRTPVGVQRVAGAHVSIANQPPADEVEELEALSVDDFDDLDEDDDEYEGDDEDEEDDESEESAPARVGIRLGAARPAPTAPAPRRAEPPVDEADDDTIDPEWALPLGVDVVESYRESAFETEGKALDSEVMIQSESESPFEVLVEPTEAPSTGGQVVEERDRALPVLALVTSTFGLMAGAVLGGIGLVAMISIFSAFDEDSEAPQPVQVPAEAQPPVVPPDGEATEEATDPGATDPDATDPDATDPDASEEEPVDEPAAPDGSAPAPKPRRKKVPETEPEPLPEPVTPAPVAPTPKPQPVPEPEPEPEDDKKGLFRKKKK